MQQKHYIGAALAAGLVIGIGAWLLVSPRSAGAPGLTKQTASTTSATSSGGDVSIETSGVGTATIGEQVPAPKPPTPAALVFSGTLDADVKEVLQNQYATLTAQLAKTPTRVDLWISLGGVYKIAGQYEAAASAWSYVAKSDTNLSTVASGNLGDLYLNFMHDYAKAAAAYRVALKGAPTNPDYQAGLKAAQAQL